MAFEVEHVHAIPRLREDQTVALHHLARSGKAMRDHDHGAGFAIAVFGDRCRAIAKLGDLETRTCAFEHPKRPCCQKQRQNRQKTCQRQTSLVISPVAWFSVTDTVMSVLFTPSP